MQQHGSDLQCWPGKHSALTAVPLRTFWSRLQLSTYHTLACLSLQIASLTCAWVCVHSSYWELTNNKFSSGGVLQAAEQLMHNLLHKAIMSITII